MLTEQSAGQAYTTAQFGRSIEADFFDQPYPAPNRYSAAVQSIFSVEADF